MPDLILEAQQRVADRARCKTDKLFLADILGFDFQESTHRELFDHYIPYDPSKPWAEQSDIKDRMVLWQRGSYKTTSVIVEIIQSIICFPNIRWLIMQGSVAVTRTLLKQILAHFCGEAEGSRFGELFPEFCGTKKALYASTMQFTTPARTKKQLPQATVTVALPQVDQDGAAL